MTPVEQHRSLTSSNPVLARPPFARRGGRKTTARDPRAGITVTQRGSGSGQDPDPHPEDAREPLPFVVADLMTMDHVLSRAATGLAVTASAALLSWVLLPYARLGTPAAYGVAAGAGLAAAALVVLQRRRNLPSPTLTLLFAAFQGVFLAVLSTTVSRHLCPGVFVQTVLGTMAAFAGVLFAQGLHWVRANRRRTPYLGAGLVGVCFLALADWILFPLLGADGLGLRPVGPGVLTGLAGVLLATSFLALHVRKVEDGITYGADRDQSWTAAFGLTLSLTWLYVETVRLLTLVPGEDRD